MSKQLPSLTFNFCSRLQVEKAVFTSTKIVANLLSRQCLVPFMCLSTMQLFKFFTRKTVSENVARSGSGAVHKQRADLKGNAKERGEILFGAELLPRS